MITPLARKVEVKGKCCNSYSHYRECGDRLQLPIVQEKSMPWGNIQILILPIGNVVMSYN